MSGNLLMALALMLVLEGILPFVAPGIWKETFRRATELAPDQPHTFLNLAHLLLMRGKVAEARTAIEKAATIAPCDDAVRVEQARITAALGDHNKAREMVIRALELNPLNREAQEMMRSGS